MNKHSVDLGALPPVRWQPRRLSEVFAALAAGATGPVTIAQIRDALGDRSFAALLVFFAAVNLLPLPPGTSAILGLPIIIVAAQMLFGARMVWLPKRLLNKSLSQTQFRGLMRRLVPWLERFERMVRPRYWPFPIRQGERVTGALALLFGIAVVLPIPLGNWLPALATTLYGLALSERDGVLFLAATIVGILSLLVIGLVVGSAGVAFGAVWSFAGSHLSW